MAIPDSNANGVSYWTRRHIVVELLDATGAHRQVVPSGEGDVSIGNLNAGTQHGANREAVPVYNPGRFEGMIEGDDSTNEFSVTCRIPRTALTPTTRSSIVSCLTYKGAWSDAVTADPLGEVNCHRVLLRLSNASAETTLILLPNARITGTFTDGEIVTLALSGTNYEPVLFDADATAAV